MCQSLGKNDAIHGAGRGRFRKHQVPSEAAHLQAQGTQKRSGCQSRSSRRLLRRVPPSRRPGSTEEVLPLGSRPHQVKPTTSLAPGCTSFWEPDTQPPPRPPLSSRAPGEALPSAQHSQCPRLGEESPTPLRTLASTAPPAGATLSKSWLPAARRARRVSSESLRRRVLALSRVHEPPGFHEGWADPDPLAQDRRAAGTRRARAAQRRGSCPPRPRRGGAEGLRQGRPATWPARPAPPCALGPH